MMIVLEKVSATATYSDSTVPRPSQADREAGGRGEGHLPQARGDGHRTDGADQAQVEPQPDHEEQHRDADLREDLDRGLLLDDPEDGRPHQDAHRDEADHQGLAQQLGQRPQHGRHHQHEGDLDEEVVGQRHRRPSSARRARDREGIGLTRSSAAVWLSCTRTTAPSPVPGTRGS